MKSLIFALLLTAAVSGGADLNYSVPPLDHRDKLYDIDVSGENIWIVGFPGVLMKAKISDGKFDFVAAISSFAAIY